MTNPQQALELAGFRRELLSAETELSAGVAALRRAVAIMPGRGECAYRAQAVVMRDNAQAAYRRVRALRMAVESGTRPGAPDDQ